MEGEIFNTLGGVMGGIASWIPAILFLVFIAIIAYIAYATGILIPRPYTCIIKIPRLGGGFKTKIAKARRLKGGQFEIAYGLFMIRKVSGPKDDQIGEGNICGGISTAENEVQWFEREEVDGSTINFKTHVSESAELAFATAYAQAYELTHRPNPLMELAVPASVIIAALIIAIGVYLYGGMVKDGMEVYSGAVNANSELLKNATIVVYKSTSTTAGNYNFPNQPASNTPPG